MENKKHSFTTTIIPGGKMSLPNITGLSTKQLIDLNEEVVRLIKARRAADSAQARCSLQRGNRVTFKDNYGRLTYGTIEKVMRTRANVRTQDGRSFKCHLTLLTKI